MHEEGIDYDETFALVARFEAIRLSIAFTSYKEFPLYQMDIKNAFLNYYLKRRYMQNNHLDLGILNSDIMYTSLIRPCMD